MLPLHVTALDANSCSLSVLFALIWEVVLLSAEVLR